MNGNILWRIDAQTNLVPSDIDDRYHNVIADDDALITVSGQNQHDNVLPCAQGAFERTMRHSQLVPLIGHPATEKSAVVATVCVVRNATAVERPIMPIVSGNRPAAEGRIAADNRRW